MSPLRNFHPIPPTSCGSAASERDVAIFADEFLLVLLEVLRASFLIEEELVASLDVADFD